MNVDFNLTARRASRPSDGTGRGRPLAVYDLPLYERGNILVILNLVQDLNLPVIASPEGAWQLR
jgi:hypothetical protein